MRNATSDRAGFSDDLEYQGIDGAGKIRLKDGSLLGGFWFDGIDLESAGEGDIVNLVRSMNLGFRHLDGGWSLHLEHMRRQSHEYVPGHFSNAVNRVIDEERAERARHFRTDNAMFFAYKPDATERNELAQRMKAMVTGGEVKDIEQMLLSQKETFEEKFRELEVAFERGGLRVERIRTAEKEGDVDPLLSALNFCINGQAHPVRSTEDGQYLDVLLADDLLNAEPMRYGDRYVRVVSPTIFPRTSRVEMLVQLSRLDIEFRWSTRFIFRSDLQNRILFGDLANKWHQQEESLWAHMLGLMNKRKNADAEARGQEIRAAKEELDGGIGYGRLTTAVVVMADDDDTCLRNAQQVVKAFQSSGFIAKIERRNAREALLGSFPGHSKQNVRRGPMSTVNLTHLVSLGREWEGHDRCPSPMYGPDAPPLLQAVSTSGTRFFLNTHDGDLGHAIVIGGSGSGKSTLLAAMASQFGRYPDGQVIGFDLGNSMRTLAWAMPDAVHYDLGAPNGPQLCPLATLSTTEDRVWAASWLEGLFADIQMSLGDRERQLLNEAVRHLATSTMRASERTLTHLVSRVQDERLKRGLQAFTAEGSQNILNGKSDDLSAARFTIFETEQLMNGGGKAAAAALRYVFRSIERDRLDGRPTFIPADEIWKLIYQSPEAAAQFSEWFRTLRKKNASLVLASQSPKDFVDSPIADAVLQNCPTRIFCANPEATNPAQKSIYMDHFGLREHQVTLLSKMRPKHDYLYACRGRVRVFGLDLGPVSLAFTGCNAKKDLKAVEVLREQHGPSWPARWLEARGLDAAGDRFERLSDAMRGSERGAA